MSSSLAELIHQAQDGFAVNLLYELSVRNATHQSVVVSPISVAMALSMVLLGAEDKDKTAHEMDQLLANNANFIGNGFPGAIIGGYFRKQLKALANQTETKYTLEMANRVFVKSGLHVELLYKNSVKYFYGRDLERVDFNDSHAAADRINGFVANATHEKIQELVEPDMFDAFSSRIVLVNAIYFKGLWAHPFNPKETVKRTFHVDEGHQKELEMMVTTGNFEYSETVDSQHLILPYSGNDIKLHILLPKNRFGHAEILANFSASQTLLGSEQLGRERKHEVRVVLPKFKLESTHDLKTPLGKLGMPRAFSNEAQFGLISNEDDMKIDFVVQKAVIEINEEGTEASGATAVGNIVPVSNRIPPPPVEFVADHPFAFFLIANNGPLQNDVLFAGMFYG